MPRTRTLARWMPVAVLALLPILHAVVASAGPGEAPMLGFTPTCVGCCPKDPGPCPPCPTCPIDDEGCCPKDPVDCPPNPTCIITDSPTCDPVITKRCELVQDESGDRVTFTIQVTNRGQQASVHAQVIDEIPEYLEILDVTTTQGEVKEPPLDQKPIEGQKVIVDVGTIGQDYPVTITVYTRVRENAPTRVPVQNLAVFEADNCPERRADCSWTLEESGGTSLWWTVVAGAGTVLLVLSLVLAQRRRS